MRPLRSKDVSAKGISNYESDAAIESIQPELLEESNINGQIADEEATLITLESALIQLTNLEDAAEALVEAGVSEEVADTQIAPLVSAAVATVDSELAEETTLTLESEGSGGFWKKIKDTVKKIWEAIVATLGRISAWLKGLFKNEGNIRKSVEKMLGFVKSRLSGKSLKTSSIPLQARWSINNETSTATDIVKSTADSIRFSEMSEQFAVALLKDARTVVDTYHKVTVGEGSPNVERIDQIERTEKKVNFETPAAIAERYKDIKFNEFVGFAFKEGKFVSSTVSESARITTCTTEQANSIVRNIDSKLKAETKGTVGDKLTKQLEDFEKEVAKIQGLSDKLGDLDKDLIARINKLPAKINAVFSVIRSWFGNHDMKASMNALTFVTSSL